MKFRYLYLTVCGLVLAGIVHISIILLIPDYGSRDAWNIISSKTDMWVFRTFSRNDDIASALEDTDPFLQLGACTFDLGEAGLQFTGAQSNKFWSLSVFDQDGKVLYSLNNRTAIDNKLDLVVLNAVQMNDLREAPPGEIERSVVVEADIEKGFVVLRQFRNDLETNNDIDAFMQQAKCKRFNS